MALNINVWAASRPPSSLKLSRVARVSLPYTPGFGFAFSELPQYTNCIYLQDEGAGTKPTAPWGAHALISHSRLELMCVSATWGGGRVLFRGFIRHLQVTPKLFLLALGESG